MRNPKSEIRNPRTEPASYGPGFWSLEAGTGALILKDAGPAPPREFMERTALFAKAVIRFAKKTPNGPATNRLTDQLVGAGSGVAADHYEADDSVSGKDLKKSIGACRKESKETMLFLRLAAAGKSLASEARTLWREARELNPVFDSIWRK